MTIAMYDLVGRDDARFSPYCWRTRMSLAHKGLDFEAIPKGFNEIREMLDGNYPSVPVIDDGGTLVRDSWEIAEYLEKTYPDAPSLFGGENAKALCRFIQSWSNSILLPGMAVLIVDDVFQKVRDEDRDYFRQSREKRFGKPLPDVQAGREQRVEGFRQTLNPIRLTLSAQPFIGGSAPTFADYIVFGTFQWPRIASTFQLLADEDPINEWINRCLDLHGGLARTVPAAG